MRDRECGGVLVGRRGYGVVGKGRGGGPRWKVSARRIKEDVLRELTSYEAETW